VSNAARAPRKTCYTYYKAELDVLAGRVRLELVQIAWFRLLSTTHYGERVKAKIISKEVTMNRLELASCQMMTCQRISGVSQDSCPVSAQRSFFELGLETNVL